MQYVQCTRALQSQQITDLFSRGTFSTNLNAACGTKPARRQSSSSSFDLLTEDAVSTTLAEPSKRRRRNVVFEFASVSVLNVKRCLDCREYVAYKYRVGFGSETLVPLCFGPKNNQERSHFVWLVLSEWRLTSERKRQRGGEDFYTEEFFVFPCTGFVKKILFVWLKS